MLAASLLLFVATPPGAVADIQVLYRADDRPDSEPGKDLWQYTYTVSGAPFAEQDGLRIYFPMESYTDVAVIDFPATWDAVALAPDELFPDQAFLAQALQPTSATAIFVVEFHWLGEPATLPGSQRAELFDANLIVYDPPGTFATQLIPEPKTSLLMLAGLALLAVSMRRRFLRAGPDR